MLSARRMYTAALALCLVPLTWAIQADLAGVVDWHKELIGEPLLEPTPPKFVDTSAGRRVIALTKSNVLAALDADTGDVAWRYQLDLEDPVVNYFVQDDHLLLLSGPGGRLARLFSLSTGHSLWTTPLLPISRAQLLNPPHLGAHAAFVPDGSSVIVMSAGMRVARLSIAGGTEMWGMDAPGAGDTILFTQAIVSGESVHLLAITHSIATPTLATLTLDLTTSIPKGDFTQIPCVMEAPTDAFLAPSDIEGGARVVWFDLGRIRDAYITAGGLLGNTKDLLPGGGRYYDKIIPTGTEQSGIILGRVKNSGEVHVLNVKAGGKRVTVWDNSRESPDRSPSTYSGALTSTGAVFARTFWSYPQSWSVIEAMSVSHNGDIVNSGYTFAFDTNHHGVVLSTAVTPMLPFEEMKEKTQFMPTLMLTTSSGALQLVHSQGIAWTREESLADITVAKFVDLGEPEVHETREILHDEGFVARTTRHLSELRALPDYLARFTNRLVSGSTTSSRTRPLVPGKLHRDQFGLQKLLIAATSKGKLFALDSANGSPIWSRNLGVTGAAGAELTVRDMWNVRAVGEEGDALVAVLATRTVGENITTVAYHVNAFTGEPRGDVDPTTGIPVAKELFKGEAEAAFLIPFENCGTDIKVLAVVDQEKHVHLFPKCKKVAAGLSIIASSFFFTTTTPTLTGSTLTGHSLLPAPSGGMSLSSIPLWNFQITAERIISNTPVQMDAIASFGRATGDKGVLYKYQNPHLSVLVTAAQRPQGMPLLAVGSKENEDLAEYGKVQVVDTASGSVMYAVQVPAIRGEVRAAMVENWLVYAWLESDGWRVGSTELYEDRAGKGLTPGASSFSGDVEITSRTQTFFLPSGMKAMSFSTSRFGVTAKELIYINARGQVASIPRRVLDPRRPKGKPTSADKEEMLLPYDSVVPIDSKRVISHTYPILGATNLVSSPALIESTSLLFTHGLDLFLTRAIAPSGTFDILTDGFNKVQLLLTLAGLSVGIAVAKPAVERKMLNMRWY